MRTSIPSHLPIFRSDGQLALLGLLLLNPDSPRTQSELGEATGLPPASVHRELRRALDAGLVRRDDSTRPHLYSAAPASPLFEPLSLLLDRTVGVETRVRGVLEETAGVEAAWIHGSWAAGTIQPDSDVDLVVLGDVDGAGLRRRLRKLGRRVGRRIDLTVLRPGELEERLARGEGFAVKLAQGPLTLLLGELPSGASR